MSEPYLGEIRMVGFNFAPYGWAMCNGQLLAIDQYSALYAVIGTTYGGNGTTNFALPDLQGRVPLHWGTNSEGDDYVIGENAGTESVNLLLNQIPAHVHGLTNVSASQPANTNVGTTNIPAVGNVSAQAVDLTHQPVKMYGTAADATTTLAPIQPTGTTQLVGGGQPHENRQPSLVVTYVIALFGIFPSRN